MKSYYKLARAIERCYIITLCEAFGGDIDQLNRYLKVADRLLALAKKRDEQRTCGSCRHWFHKSSTEKDWGRCTNTKVHESTHITFRDIPEGVSPQTMIAATKCCEIRTEENSFGCIHHWSEKLEP